MRTLLLTCSLILAGIGTSALAGESHGDRAWLGVMLSQERDNRATVLSVADDSPAAKAGLRAGDEILAVDGRDFEKAHGLFADHRPGDDARLEIRRDGRDRTIDVVLGSWSERGHAFPRFEGRHLLPAPHAPHALHPAMPPAPPVPPAFAPDHRYELRTTKSRARLGLAFEPLNDQLAEYFGAEPGSLLVREVFAGSVAEEAGVEAGDVLVAVDDRKVRSAHEVLEQLSRHQRGDQVVLEVLRRGSTRLLTPILDRDPLPMPERLERRRR